MRTIAVVNQKGGCGKPTSAINLAAVYARRGLRTLLVDVDPQSHCAAGLGVPERRIEFEADAGRQVEMGRAYLEEVFGVLPDGMWPPEGALSERCLRAACEMGIRWVAADETTLNAVGLDQDEGALAHVGSSDDGPSERA